MDFFAVDLDVFKLGSNQRLMVLFELIWWEWLHSSVEEGISPLEHHLLHLADVVFHQSNEFVDFGDNFHGVLDEWVNAWGVPSEIRDTWLESLVDSLDSIIEQWFFNWEKSFKNLIVNVDNDVEISLLTMKL